MKGLGINVPGDVQALYTGTEKTLLKEYGGPNQRERSHDQSVLWHRFSPD